MTALDHVNAIADRSPGFVWRLVGDGANDATALRARHGEAEVMVNMSVWESREALWGYVYRSDHLDFLRRRGEWFQHAEGPILVLWWVRAGAVPTVDEAVDRLATLHERGPTPAASTFRHWFPPDPAEPGLVRSSP